MLNRSEDWFKQAVRDLEKARDSQAECRHEWACFVAQQATEKAVKAAHLYHGQEAWGHVVAKLLTKLPQACQPTLELIDKAKVDVFFFLTA